MITLRSSDGKNFDVDEAVAVQMQTINSMIEDGCAGTAVPVPNVSGEILAKVITYCKKHVETAQTEELKAWDAGFIKVDQAMLYDLMLAANYLHVKSLLDLACQRVADIIKGKSPEEIRAIFNIENDFTPEEEEEIRRPNQWAFE